MLWITELRKWFHAFSFGCLYLSLQLNIYKKMTKFTGEMMNYNLDIGISYTKD